MNSNSETPNFFSHFEMMRVSASKIIYKREQAVILTFNNVSEHKAQIQMMSSHNQQLTNFVEKFKNQVELSLLSWHLNKTPGDTGSM
jgi:hypothetical protein